MKKLFVVLLVSAAVIAHSQDRGLTVVAADNLGANVSIGKQYALFIAIDAYRHWPALKKPVSDAREIRDILRRDYYIDEVIELYNQQASRANITRTFTELQTKLGVHDSLFIYYAGHGHYDGNSDAGFWIPVDGGTDLFAQENWLPNNQIRGYISRFKTVHVFMVSDACFSGDILNTTRALPPQIDNAYYRRAYALTSRQVLTSGSSETVPDQSEFSSALINCLRKNTSPLLDPISIYNDVRLTVRKTTPLYGTLNAANHQDGATFLFFRRQAAVTQPPPPPPPERTVSTAVGTITITSEIAGEILIDGKTTGSSIKAGGTLTVANISTGETEVAVKAADGKITKTAQPVMVRQGQTVAAAIKRPATTPPPAQPAAAPPPVQTTPSVPQVVGSVTVTSQIAGVIMIDGVTTGKRINANKKETIDNVRVGTVEVAIQADDRNVYIAPKAVTVRQGKNVSVAIRRSTAKVQSPPQRKVVGNIPMFVKDALKAVPEDALIGIGAAKMGTLSLSRTAATTYARAEISRQMDTMIRDMVRDYAASSEVDPYAIVSFTENISTALSKAELKSASTVMEDIDDNGNYWVVVMFSKANTVAEINQALAAAKLAVPAMRSFNIENRMDEAFAKAISAEVGFAASFQRKVANGIPQFVKDALKSVPRDALIGIGTAKMGTLSLSRTAATTRARAEISRQMAKMVLDMVRDYTASSGVDPSTITSFTDNITTALYRAELKGATSFMEDMDDNGNYWVVKMLSKANAVAEINQALAAAKLAVPAMSSFNAEARMDAAFARAVSAEVGFAGN